MAVFKKSKPKVNGHIKSIRLDYISGHPEFLSESQAFVGKGQEPMTIFMNGRILLIKKVEWEENRKRSMKKIAGGIILAGVTRNIGGLILGAVIGNKKKDESIVLVSFTERNYEGILRFRCNQHQYRNLISLLL